MPRTLKEALQLCGFLVGVSVVATAHAGPGAPADHHDATGDAFRATDAASNVSAASFRCARGEDCGDSWQGVLAIAVASGCLGGIVYIVRRARRPESVHLVSLLVALDASGESIKERLAQLSRRVNPQAHDALHQWAQRSSGLLLEYHAAWTHAGTHGPVELLDKRSFARWRAELGSRNRAHHAAYQGTQSYTVVALLLATREPPPALSAPGHQQVEEYLRAVARLRLQAFEVLCLPSRDRRMTLRELIERYPELFPLDVHLSRASGA